MKPLDILSALVETSNIELQKGQYMPIPTAPEMKQLESLKNSLGLLGASIQDYMMTADEDGDLYLCNPSLQKSKDGDLILFFSPEKQYQIPETAMLLGGNSLVIKSKTEPITVRKMKDAAAVLTYSDLLDSVGEGARTIISLVEFIQEEKLQGLLFKFSEIESKKSAKGHYFIAKVECKPNDDGVISATCFIDSKIYTTLTLMDAMRKETALILNLKEYIGRDGSIKYKVVPSQP